jgi:hypothetical protein
MPIALDAVIGAASVVITWIWVPAARCVVAIVVTADRVEVAVAVLVKVLDLNLECPKSRKLTLMHWS